MSVVTNFNCKVRIQNYLKITNFSGRQIEHAEKRLYTKFCSNRLKFLRVIQIKLYATLPELAPFLYIQYSISIS